MTGAGQDGREINPDRAQPRSPMGRLSAAPHRRYAGLATLVFVPERMAARQTREKIPRVGILSPADSDKTPIFDAFREGLRDLCYVEGRNIILEFRLARGDYNAIPRLAQELANLPVDIIVTDGGTTVAQAAASVGCRSRKGWPRLATTSRY